MLRIDAPGSDESAGPFKRVPDDLMLGKHPLIAFAIALIAATLQTLIGPMGTLLTVIIIVFIGNPSTGSGNGVAFLPPSGRPSAQSCRHATGST